MAGLYTDLAKTRIEQSKKNSDTAVHIPAVTLPALEADKHKRDAAKPPVSPLPAQPSASQHMAAKKQISAYLTHPQHTIFKQLYHKLNSTDANVDKGEIVGLSLEVLSALLPNELPNFPTLARLREFLLTKVAKT